MNTPTESVATHASSPVPAAAAGPAPESQARHLFAFTLGCLIFAIVLGYLAWQTLGFGSTVTTDNAYVQGNVIQITPQIAGTVLAVRADDTDFVRAGQPLARLDPADSQMALDQAEAALAQTVREVRTLYANNAVLGAQISLRRADVARLESEVVRAQRDASRREALVQDGAVGIEELEHANTQLVSARSSLESTRAAARTAQSQLAANQSLTDRTTVERHPNVLRASARVREAYLALRRAEILAPVTGFVARRSVQVGQRVQAGAGLMTVVPLDGIWVDANFKEAQLRNLRVGQAATLVTDIYGNAVHYHGKVAGLGAGTGTAFALLPAQNASGNWIKVVQRVPVRILLDPREVAAHPLRIGLSVEVSVETRLTDGPRLGDSRPPTSTVTSVFDATDHAAEEAVRRIIADNLPENAGADLGASAPSAGARKADAVRSSARGSSPHRSQVYRVALHASR